MHVRYAETIYLTDRWSSTAADDWLHPAHGPLPDLVGRLSYGKTDYIAALWEGSRSLTVMLELPGLENPDPEIPMRNNNAVYHTRGWIAQTYYWEITRSGIRHKDVIVVPDAFEEQPHWRDSVYHAILEECVRMCAES